MIDTFLEQIDTACCQCSIVACSGTMQHHHHSSLGFGERNQTGRQILGAPRCCEERTAQQQQQQTTHALPVLSKRVWCWYLLFHVSASLRTVVAESPPSSKGTVSSIPASEIACYVMHVKRSVKECTLNTIAIATTMQHEGLISMGTRGQALSPAVVAGHISRKAL